MLYQYCTSAPPHFTPTSAPAHVPALECKGRPVGLTHIYICIYEQGASSNDDLHFYIVGKGTFDIHRKATPHACSKWPGLSRLVTVAGLWAPAWLLRLLGERTLAAALALARSSLLAY